MAWQSPYFSFGLFQRKRYFPPFATHIRLIGRIEPQIPLNPFFAWRCFEGKTEIVPKVEN
jgi:hypothetical protein